MTDLAWVVGRGGLLGSHVERALRARAGFPLFRAPAFPWTDRARLTAVMSSAVASFEDEARRHDGWAVLWCAGAGVVGASAASLAEEVSALERFLSTFGADPGRGCFFLASSAGGIWGGAGERPITEDTPPRPISAYGVAQLEKEQALARWAERRPGVSTLVGRLANLYGPGQAPAKAQGLVSSLSRALLHGRPAHVFVSLDTIRDYLYVEDAAREIVHGLERLRAESTEGPRRVTKILASERATTIGELLGCFRRTAKRPLRVVTGLHAAASQQPACLQFRSVVWMDEPRIRPLGLPEGIDRVLRHELASYQRGGLRP